MTTLGLTQARERVPASAWRMLALGVSAQAAGSLFATTPAYLIPLLHLDRGVPLAQAGVAGRRPVSRHGHGTGRLGRGDRPGTGSDGSSPAASRSPPCSPSRRPPCPGYVGFGVLFVLGGTAAASTSAASGRVVMG